MTASTTNVSWRISTAANLEVSPVFQLGLALPGALDYLALSNTFNISASAEPASTPSSLASSKVTSLTVSSTPSTSASIPSGRSSTSILSGNPARTTSNLPPLPNYKAKAQSSSGLSTSAKVGIGVGVPAAVLFGLLLGWFLVGRNKTQAPVAQPDYRESWKPELSAESPMSPQVHHELLCDEIPGTHELPGSGSDAELSGQARTGADGGMVL